MTIRWKTGKEPTATEIADALSNAVPRPIETRDIDAMVQAIQKLYRDRIEGRR